MRPDRESPNITLLPAGYGDTVHPPADGGGPQGDAALRSWERELDRLGSWSDVTAAGERTALFDRPLPGPVFVTGPAGSALDVLWTLVKDGRLPPWGAVVSQSQWSGRGQLRRPWQSPTGNLYAGVRWPAERAEAAGFANQSLPLVVGLCVAMALDPVRPGLAIKWPNDLMLNDRKVGGVLVEDRGGVVAAGIGLNLWWAPDAASLRTESAVAAGTLFDGVPPEGSGPLGVWLALHDNLARAFDALVAAGPRDAMQQLTERLAWRGRDVFIHDADDSSFDNGPYKILQVEFDGSLCVGRGSSRLRLHSGSIAPQAT